MKPDRLPGRFQALKVGSAQLSNLHTFECAARHMNFTSAAEELCLTQSAVSHRVNKLEQQLGFKLFQRLHRSLKLTPEGERLFSVTRDALREIGEEIHRVRNNELTGTVRLFAHPSITQCWLVPRLLDFTEKYPAIQLDIRTGNDNVNFRTEQADLALYYSSGTFPGLKCIKLMEEAIAPVCSAEYAKQYDLIGKPEHLESCKLLYDAHAWYHSAFNAEWLAWAQVSGIALPALEDGMIFDRADLATIAAMNNVGVAMGRQQIVEKSIRSGKLVMPFGDMICEAVYSYYLVFPDGRRLSPRVATCIQWLWEQAGNTGGWEEAVLPG